MPDSRNDTASSPPPGLARALCALCGPLSEEEVQSCGLNLQEEPGVIHQRRLYLARKQFPWRTLRAWYQSQPDLREAADRVEDWRRQREKRLGRAAFELSPGQLGSRMRYALVTGQHQEFIRLYQVYASTLQALSDHTQFSILWEQVLGPGLEGAAEVHGSIQREQLTHLISSHYAFSAYPADSLVFGRDLHGDDSSDLLYELRTADIAALQQRRKLRGEHSLAGAALCMLQGKWKEACAFFADCLPDNMLDFPYHSEGEVGVLYLYASICAIRAEDSPRRVRRWLSVARRCIDLYMDASYSGTTELVRMADYLEWVFNTRQQGGQVKMPDAVKGAPMVPLLWGAAYLLPSERESLDPETFPALVRELQAKELTLAASYAASCALLLVPYGSRVREELHGLLKTLPRVAPLANPSTVLPPDEQQMLHMEAWVDSCTPPRTHLYWDLTLNKEQTGIAHVELRLADAPELAGRRFSPNLHFWSDLHHLMDDHDTKTIPLLETLGYGARDALREVSCLVGHPRVRLSKNGELHPVTVLGKRPELLIRRKDEKVVFYQQSLRLPHQLVDCTERSITLPLSTHADVATREYFQGKKKGTKSGIMTLVSPDPMRLQELLERLSQGFELSGDILPPDIPQREATPRLVAELSLRRHALCSRLLLSLLPDSSHLSQPGAGLTCTLLPAGEQLVCVRRDIVAERQLVQELLARCPDLQPIQPGVFPLVFHGLRDEQSQLRLLQQLRAAGVSILWSGSKRLTAYAASREQLNITVAASLPGWLEIGGHLKVDEDRVISLSELLESTLGRDRIILSDGTLILTDAHITTMLRQLRAAHGGASDGPGNRSSTIRLSHAALPSVCEAGKDLLPDAIHRACPDLSEKKWRLPAGLHAELRDYQMEGYRWLCTRAEAGIGMCLADDMGLGKTVQTLALLLRRARGGAALVVTPLSLLGNWREEVRRFTPSLTVKLYSEWDGQEALPDNCLLMASYGQLANSPERAQATIWHTLVLDEAQSIRNHSTKRTKAILSLRAEARLALTGTPVENGLSDLWSIMNFLNPGLLGNLRSFRARYRSEEELPVLHNLVRPLVLRRTRQQVLPQLPSLTEIEWKVELSTEERALYEATRRRALNIMEQHGSPANLFAELTRLRRLCCHGKLAVPSFKGKSSKLEALMELVTELRESGHKALVFSQFTDVLDLVEPLLAKAGISFLRLDGTTKASRRTHLVEQFQRGEADLFLISLKAGGVGLNLTTASYVILLDPWWNPAVESQAAARSHRIGQNQPVTLYRLIAEGTVEERVLALHQSKKHLAEAVITEGTLPLSELRQLLEG